MAHLPPVRLDIHSSWFNLLLTALHEQAHNNPYEEYRAMAEKLIKKCMTYGTPFIDGNEASCVDLRLYSKEASDTIFLLLMTLCDHCDWVHDYSVELGVGKEHNTRGEKKQEDYF